MVGIEKNISTGVISLEIRGEPCSVKVIYDPTTGLAERDGAPAALGKRFVCGQAVTVPDRGNKERIENISGVEDRRR